MMGDPEGDKPSSQLLKRRKTGSNILRKLSLTGNKKRESIIYKQMKEDEGLDEVLLDPDDSSNVRFKRSIIQINRSNSSTPIKDPGVDKGADRPGLFQRFRASFRKKTTNQRSHSSSPSSNYDPLDSDEGSDKEKFISPEKDVIEVSDDVIETPSDVIATEEAEEFKSKIENNDDHEILSDNSLNNESLQGRTGYKFSSDSAHNVSWRKRLYRSFRKSKKQTRKSLTSEPESPQPFKRRYSLPVFRRKKKGVNYEAL